MEGFPAGEVALELLKRPPQTPFEILITLFFILKDGPRFMKFAQRFLPLHREDIEEVSITIYKTVLATVYGSVGVAIVQGILGFVGYKIAGIDYAILLAIATFISSFIPPSTTCLYALISG